MEKSKVMNACPSCGYELSFIQQDGQWYCHNCQEYKEQGEPLPSFVKPGQYIVQTKRKDMKNTEVILNSKMEPLFFVRHIHSWKNTGRAKREQLRTTDIVIYSSDETFVGEIHEFPGECNWAMLLRIWKIYDANGNLKGGVQPIHKVVTSLLPGEYRLECALGNAMIQGSYKRHQYKVINHRNEILARCDDYGIKGRNSYQLVINKSTFEPFVVLSYIMVLDHVEGYNVTRGGSGGGVG